MDARGIGRWCSPIEQIRRSVVLRLFAAIFAFSCGVTLVLTAVQLYREYRQGVTLAHQRLVEVDRSYRDSLAEALWRLDRAQLDLELRGVLGLGGVSAVEVREAGAQPMVVAAGVPGGPGRVLSRDFPLMRRVQGVDRMIGMLHVEATLSGLYRSLARTAMLILVNQAANTFIVAVFITWLLNRLVTRHLASIARTVGRYDYRQPPQPLVLARTPPAAPDELDRVVTAINAMGARVYRAYLDERAAAAEREARNAAEAANSAKSAFLASMSHELRTPLNGILGYAQILQRDPKLDRAQYDAVGAILRCGEHLLGLIHDVLDFATIEAGRLRVEIGDVSVFDTVAAIRDVMAVKAVEKQILFHCDIAPDAPRTVRADERRLRQVLLNLLANAIKFTAQGTVGLHVARAPEGGVLFEVYDTGIGIEADQVERLFLPFEQGARARGRDRGIGLGLAISRQFVRAMGGDIAAESELGRGSTFRFVLPAAAETLHPTVARGAPVRVTGYLGTRHTVLVVDDIEVNRAMVSVLLTRVGFTVRLAESTEAALDIAARETVSLVLTDIVMPGKSGLELIGTLRARSGGAQLPIVAMSASSSRADVSRSVEAGADAFLPKPLDLDKLLSEVGRLLALTWVYDAAPQHRLPEADRLGDAVFDAPHDERMQSLLALARLGDMHGVRRWAQALVSDDARYASFGAALDALARACESKALLAFVERHLEGPNA
jgi:signal transduction histidine kinase/DNA-binding NarL/FixJ family response regulator